MITGFGHMQSINSITKGNLSGMLGSQQILEWIKEQW